MMNTSLRDQLLKAGLVTEKQVKQATQPQRAPSRHQPSRASQEKLAAERARLAKEARDRELNKRQQEKAAARARRAQLRQLVEQLRVPAVESDEYFNFVDGTTLRRIPVTAQLREQLIAGKLLIVRYDNRYALIPETNIAAIREHAPEAILPPQTSAQPASAEDDPYKDFVVPDDLQW